MSCFECAIAISKGGRPGWDLDSEYQEFFKKALKKFGVESPAELESDEKKKEFFDYVDKNWKGDNEKAEDTEASDTLEPKKKKLAASNCGS